MTMVAVPKIAITCAHCTTDNGNPRLLCKVDADYAVIEAWCRHCKETTTRIVMEGMVLESRRG